MFVLYGVGCSGIRHNSHLHSTERDILNNLASTPWISYFYLYTSLLFDTKSDKLANLEVLKVICLKKLFCHGVFHAFFYVAKFTPNTHAHVI